ncbi:MAG TPA: hypothetical protein VL485_11130 [Ktedonobacteraceae bacterium]|nr:hypothetical protein [Ktedonobacteraceae bacterium]
MQTQMRRLVDWRRHFLAYGMWVVSAFLIWLLVYGYIFLPGNIYTQMDRLPLWLIAPILQAVIVWAIFQMVIPDRRLPWFAAVTLLGYILGHFLQHYLYASVYASIFHFFPLSAHTELQMLLAGIIITLIALVVIALLQALFMGSILKRVSWNFALIWIAAAVFAGIVASTCSVFFELKYYLPSEIYPSLIRSVIAGAISGLPLLWLRAR